MRCNVVDFGPRTISSSCGSNAIIYYAFYRHLIFFLSWGFFSFEMTFKKSHFFYCNIMPLAGLAFSRGLKESIRVCLSFMFREKIYRLRLRLNWKCYMNGMFTWPSGSGRGRERTIEVSFIDGSLQLCSNAAHIVSQQGCCKTVPWIWQIVKMQRNKEESFPAGVQELEMYSIENA